MGSERWVFDMGRHYLADDGPAPDGGGQAVVDDDLSNIVPLFAPRTGGVAALIAAASGPAEQWELRGEAEIRATFRSAALDRPRTLHRRHRWAPFAIAAGSVAGLVAGTAGLSAAAVLPPSANHVVAQVLSQVGIDVTPKARPTAASSPTRSSAPAGSKSTSKASLSHEPPASPSPTAPAAARGVQHVVSVPACEVSAPVNPAAQSGTPNQIPNALAAAEAATPAATDLPPSCRITSGTHQKKVSRGHTGSSGGGGTGSGTGPGSGSGSGTGTGPTTGSGSGSGTGTGSGGGTGTNKGGNQGGGKGNGKGAGKGGGCEKGTGTGTGTGTWVWTEIGGGARGHCGTDPQSHRGKKGDGGGTGPGTAPSGGSVAITIPTKS